ncbi:hypothetical protein SEA_PHRAPPUCCINO_152 [Mycobacterium phage Phrappuccino]|uniref:Uncharacterized protein n=1 Tax=Mycobacterium phage Phrappuccino TaxID=2591223 RepID=A0A514DE05_9CAUD|nr:hypothetical protein KHQ87_gp152 [Mycobacterium phage Phrappuccino]QDH91827.1 hypothetical protein SEA_PHRAPPUCCINO_152 [Mycobacterium phage Phrappuccino]QIQ63269.1 hypothetical protein SEA_SETTECANDELA_152 [Mycobacterium phage Settecandela]
MVSTSQAVKTTVRAEADKGKDGLSIRDIERFCAQAREAGFSGEDIPISNVELGLQHLALVREDAV